MLRSISIYGVQGIPEISPGDALADIILDAMKDNGICLEDGDILVVAQKIVSKAEGRVYEKCMISVSPFAKQAADLLGFSPQYVELVLRESKRIVRMADGVLICQTHHGFVMAGAGVDQSNAGGRDRLIALPHNPDRSASDLRKSFEEKTGKRMAVIISDTFGRPWRKGQINQAIGLSGILPMVDYRGKEDNDGREMKVTQIAVADELASAAELISGKTKRMPVVILRGFEYQTGPGSATDLVREQDKDIFK